ncbi:hypothetical protein GOODEAATRI_006812 [Goodea atripinnis]|uniref:Uncharacterized protein n=1 Tax=Goodea atripinnis TaxID=208336 RepID=A0ABV0P228_9TELE
MYFIQYYVMDQLKGVHVEGKGCTIFNIFSLINIWKVWHAFVFNLFTLIPLNEIHATNCQRVQLLENLLTEQPLCTFHKSGILEECQEDSHERSCLPQAM